MKKIRKLAAVLVALTLLTGCSATTVKVPPIKAPSPIPSESAAATPAPAEADETAAPIESPEETPIGNPLAECTNPAHPWALCDGDTLTYVSNDGLHRMAADGSDDKLIYSADSLDLYGFYMLGSDKLLVLQKLDYEAENAIAMTMPDWMFNYVDFPIFTAVSVNLETGESTVLAENIQEPLFVSDTEMIFLTADRSRTVKLLNVETGALRDVPEMDFSNRLLFNWFVSDGSVYFQALDAEQDWEDRASYALDLASLTVRKVRDAQFSAIDQIEFHSPNPLKESDVEESGDFENLSMTYRVADRTFSLMVTRDLDAGTATLDFYALELSNPNPIAQLKIGSIYMAYEDDYDEIAEDEEAFIQAHEQSDGILYATYAEQLDVQFCGGWAFVFENGYTNDVSGGPDRLITKVNLMQN